ncbi:MAG: Rne/Rng family ribonuclease [Deltaproteobacteria bacterium]|nr:MAG: Rne/Rng family ribonuclease [Deltaproteobacteria bacterium]
MFRELVVNVAAHETRVALVEDGTISELFIERDDDSNITGNIYKGKVQRVLPGMQAAFVDVGLHQAAFIHVDEVLVENNSAFSDREAAMAAGEKADENGDDPPVDVKYLRPEPADRPRIEDLLTEGQALMVQVIKSPIGSKGARISSHISLPGRFLVLMPTVKHVGISRRIEDEGERQRLRDLIETRRDEPYGYIFRTAAEGITDEKLMIEMRFLANLWENIQRRNLKTSAPSLLHRDLNITLRAVRDLLTQDADKLVIDSAAGFELVNTFLDKSMPDLNVTVEHYQGEEPLFDAYNLEGDILRALQKKVWLRSGGYIVIEQTEALISIDVNTGRYVGKHNFEETILKTNLEALKEIAYQIRLRNLGGIIIIDFIDMEKPASQEKVMREFVKALSRDTAKTHVLPISELGLVQMTRKRVRQSLSRMLCDPCFYCEGNGALLSATSICHGICREMLRDRPDPESVGRILRVHPEIADMLHGEKNSMITALERKTGCPILIYPMPDFHLEAYTVSETRNPADIEPR